MPCVSLLPTFIMPGVLSRLLPIFATAFGSQACRYQAGCSRKILNPSFLVFASIFVPQQNEKYYDLCGSITWALSTLASLYYPSLKKKYWDVVPNASLSPLSSFTARQLLLSGAVCIWTMRLGYFLAERSIRHGGDSRFDKLKKKPTTFSYYWLMQG